MNRLYQIVLKMQNKDTNKQKLNSVKKPETKKSNSLLSSIKI
jgi:hypothetical protein